MSAPTPFIVRLQLLSAQGSPLTSMPLAGPPGALPRVGETVSLDEPQIGGMYRVERVEWQVRDRALTEVRLIARANS